MNYGDKSCLTSLIKFIKNKKIKKKSDNNQNNLNFPIIFINNLINEKKINDLFKICDTLQMEAPTNEQFINILHNLLPNLFKYSTDVNSIIKKNILLFLNNKLFKITKIIYYENNNLILSKFYDNFINIDYDIYYNIKKVTHTLLTTYYKISDINKILDTDRTIVSLLFHENIIKLFNNRDNSYKIKYYLLILENFAYCDYIDRTVFQKQIWQVNDICYIIKIFYNNYLLQKQNLLLNNNIININDIIFTKILTKYSSEYNNFLFLFNISQILYLTKREIYVYFYNISNHFSAIDILNKLENIGITKLIYNKNIKLINNQINYINQTDCNNIEISNDKSNIMEIFNNEFFDI